MDRQNYKIDLYTYTKLVSKARVLWDMSKFSVHHLENPNEIPMTQVFDGELPP